MEDPRIPAGTYPAKAVGLIMDTAGSGTDYVRVEFELTDLELQGERIHWDGWITDKATPYTIKNLKTAGWKPGPDQDIEKAMSEGLGSCEVNLVVEWDEFKGNLTAKVKFINPKMSADRAKTMKDKIRAALNSGTSKKTEIDPKDDVNW